MNAKLAKLLVASNEAEEAHEEGLRLLDDYSGRGMYGKTTHAISGHFGDLMFALVMVVAELDDEDELTPDEIAEEMSQLRSDSLGIDTVWY